MLKASAALMNLDNNNKDKVFTLSIELVIISYRTVKDTYNGRCVDSKYETLSGAGFEFY